MVLTTTTITDGVTAFRTRIGNAYLIGDVLVDTGHRLITPLIARRLRSRHVRCIVVTHAHPGHAGGAARLGAMLGIPKVYCGLGEGRFLTMPVCPEGTDLERYWSKISRFRRVPHVEEVGDGVMIGGLEVVATPGHTPGHIALWRPHDRVLACGDAVATAAPLRFREAVQPAPRLTGTDELDERESVRRLASLRPSILLPGHGNPVRTPQAIVEYAASLRI